jgi:hypothetical protein
MSNRNGTSVVATMERRNMFTSDLHRYTAGPFGVPGSRGTTVMGRLMRRLRFHQVADPGINSP